MSIRTTIVMMVILALLATLYHFRDRVQAPSDEDLARPQLMKFKPDDVTQIDCLLDGKRLVFQKQDGVWQITEPFHGLASKRDVEALVTPLSELKTDRVVAEDAGGPGNLKQYGLDKPRYTFVVHLKGSAEAPTVLIGSRSPNEVGYYAMQPGQPRVVLTGNSLAFAFFKKPEDWREKAPVALEPDQVDRVAVEAGAYRLQLEKPKDAEQWTMQQPKAGKAEAAEVTKFLGSIKVIPIAKYFPEIKPDDPRLKPVLTLKVWNKGDRDPQVMTVGQPVAGGYYALRGGKVPEVFLLPESGMKALEPDPSALADHHVFDFDPVKVAKVEVFQQDAGSATAEKKNGTWTFTKPVEKKDEMGKVTGLVYLLKEVKYEAKVTAEPEVKKAAASMAKPFARFDLFDEKGVRLGGLVVGGMAGRLRRWVQVEGQSDIYIADVSFANEWQANIKAIAAVPSPAPGASASPNAGASPAGLGSPSAGGSPAAAGASPSAR